MYMVILDLTLHAFQTAAILKVLIRERNLYDRVLIISFYPEILHMVCIKLAMSTKILYQH